MYLPTITTFHLKPYAPQINHFFLQRAVQSAAAAKHKKLSVCIVKYTIKMIIRQQKTAFSEITGIT